MSAVLDKDILDTLTDEEREAIESGDLTDTEKEALKAIADEDGEDDDDEDGEDNAGAAPIEGKGAADTDDAGANDEAGNDQAEPEPEARNFRPTYKADLPEDFDDKLATLDSQEEELARKFKDGEIDFDQYRTETRTIDKERGELTRAKLQADIYDGMNAQTAEQEWAWTVNRFMRATAENGGIDYAKDEAKRADLDVFVKALGSDEKNAGKNYDWFLAEGHKRVLALHGMAQTPKAGGDPAPSRRPPLDAAPVTLAQVPGSDGPGDVAGEFADLDSLDGDALEMAIAKMTPEQREKYAKGV